MSSGLDLIISFGSFILTVLIGFGIRICFRRGRDVGDA
jgi:hypothetical protein